MVIAPAMGILCLAFHGCSSPGADLYCVFTICRNEVKELEDDDYRHMAQYDRKNGPIRQIAVGISLTVLNQQMQPDIQLVPDARQCKARKP